MVMELILLLAAPEAFKVTYRNGELHVALTTADPSDTVEGGAAVPFDPVFGEDQRV
jgi:hypothetical protein